VKEGVKICSRGGMWGKGKVGSSGGSEGQRGESGGWRMLLRVCQEDVVNVKGGGGRECRSVIDGRAGGVE